MESFFNQIANNPNVRAARDAVANLPPPVKKVAKVGMIGVGTGVAVFATPPLLGFTAGGVAAGSIAAAIQSTVFGAAVPAGSWFAAMQSIGATATVIPALIAGASAAGVAGTVEAGQAQYSEGNQETRGDGDKGAGDQNEKDQEKREEGEEQSCIGGGKDPSGSPGHKKPSTIRDSSSCEEGDLQVASPGEGQGSIRRLDVGHGTEIFRPRNNQS
ncbi:hypothetical protein OPQ81_002323 [Rhizoctonia solani]|nr:hypothetical protein OPQ81_002323 [Rhizoctonia solani]